jgi:hypothetical protein
MARYCRLEPVPPGAGLDQLLWQLTAKIFDATTTVAPPPIRPVGLPSVTSTAGRVTCPGLLVVGTAIQFEAL